MWSHLGALQESSYGTLREKWQILSTDGFFLAAALCKFCTYFLVHPQLSHHHGEMHKKKSKELSQIEINIMVCQFCPNGMAKWLLDFQLCCPDPYGPCIVQDNYPLLGNNIDTNLTHLWTQRHSVHSRVTSYAHTLWSSELYEGDVLSGMYLSRG